MMDGWMDMVLNMSVEGWFVVDCLILVDSYDLIYEKIYLWSVHYGDQSAK